VYVGEGKREKRTVREMCGQNYGNGRTNLRVVKVWDQL